ncbi:MAG: DMT family transporter [Xanthobacteraceae bacterium]|nr:DMT family transporter [Xanthobacteraceae bacterium]
MLAATVLFAGSSATSKWLVATYPIGEVLFSRSVTSLLGVSLAILPFTGLAVFRTKRLRDHAMRGVSQASSQAFLMIAFSLMPLASAVAINFSAPLFATIAAVIFLKEPVGAVRWGALIVGFVGVLLVTSPGADTFQTGSLYALCNAVLFGTVTVGVRGMTATESTTTLMMWQLTILAVTHTFLLLFGFRWPTPVDAALFVLSGVCNVIGQFLWTRALLLAPATAVSPFYYLMLVWALLIGFLVWGDVPTLGLLAGSVIVVGSGLFLLWHESSRRPRNQQSAAAAATGSE